MIRRAHTLAALALALSAAAHAAGLVGLWSEPDIQIEGGAVANAAMLGNSFQDVLTGQPAPVEPSETTPDKPEGITEAEPPELTLSAQSARQPIQTDAIPALSAPTLAQIAPIPLAPSEKASTLAPIQTALPALKPDTAQPSPPAAQEVQKAATGESAPVLSSRPKIRPRAVEEAARQAKQAPELTSKPTPKPKTAQGSQAPAQKAGLAEGQAKAKRSQKTASKGKAKTAGNAAVSNYPGQVATKIRRTRRARSNARGTATVRFTIAANGSLASVGLARSSGNPKLDKIALDQIRRAAPFPKPPSGAQRSYTIPIRGK